ncbi:major facilitator superfamily domain-containing protein [Aspergillus bertholletiae]|uniref:Major facilitator superfamily domain-containing protein n=1 Tax=Aspergillus bertholletiae TaxID=1226010 RepID=A0A5N7BDN1_9EURO|nr:major facilitator superfamily domain-containing protein [Aspergillus bertholletiae]
MEKEDGSPRGSSPENDSESGSTTDGRAPGEIIQWDEDDPDHPFKRSLPARWLTVITVSLCSLCVACTSSIYTTTYGQILKEFHCSQEIATLGLSLFVFGMGLGPLVLGPLSEVRSFFLYGRRVIFLSSFVFFLIWLIPCAVARNIQTLLIARFFNGFSGSAFLSVAGGTVGDMFPRHQLAAPMMIYTASPFVGPELGPLVGGFINQYTNWRWTFYVLLIWTATLIVSIYFFVPETHHPAILTRKARVIRKKTGNTWPRGPNENSDVPLRELVLRSVTRPIMLLVLEPMCMSLCVYSALLLGILYLFFGAFQTVFLSVYGFELWQRGLTFLGLLVGMVFAILSDPLWRRNYERLEKEHQARDVEASGFFPEWRLPPAIAGAPLVTIGLFIFSWTTYSSVHWIVPLIGSAFFGAGTILVYSGIFTFLVEAYPSYAASALAANSFTRSTFAAAFPLFGAQMYNRLGIHWASCLLAFLTLAMVPFPYIFYKYGPRIRKKSRFTS